jgi:hypothetical protein
VTETLHPHVATLLKAYARELADTEPSTSLDARIEQLVAAEFRTPAHGASRYWRDRRVARWAAAACFVLVGVSLSVTLGVAIGVRLERGSAAPRSTDASVPRDDAWPPPEFSMWPTDSVALQIPVEYAPDGSLVAVDSRRDVSGARYWVDVIVSNDGTVRIERVVPAAPIHDGRGTDDGIILQSP